MSQPESRLQRRIRKALVKSVGGFWWKVWGGPFQPAGLPDLCGCVNGRFIALEVKRPGEEPSPVQRKRMRDLRSVGAIVAVVTSAEEAIEFVREALIE